MSKPKEMNWDLLFSILKEWANDSKILEILKNNPVRFNDDTGCIEFMFVDMKDYERVKQVVKWHEE